MRLKFLFFPVMLILSISIFYGYVWPEITAAKQYNQDYLQKQKDLTQVTEKQESINSIGEKLKNDPVIMQTVYSFLPQKSSEEQIINNINYLATSSSVSLANIALNDVSPKLFDPLTDLSVAPILPAAGSVPANGSVNLPENSIPQNAENIDGSMHYTEANISLSGSYENIGIFLNQLQHSGMNNEIKTLTIKTGESSQGLSANLTVDFGYIPAAKFNNQAPANFQATFNPESIQPLQKFVSQKTQNIEIGTTGKANPFQQ